jgi:2-aminoadipate transaminase
MTETTFQYAPLLSAAAPAPGKRFAGFPKYNFVGGHNDPQQIPTEALAEAAATVLRRDGHKLALYNLGQGRLGYLELRKFLAGKLSAKRGMTCTAEDILVTTGSGQALDLVNTILVQPGDCVIMEEFTYSGAIDKARQLGAEVIGVPLDRQGMRVDLLAPILEGLRQRGVTPKYIYTIPTVQNPTGTVLSLERRLQLVELSRQYGVPIFEDECYADLTWAMDAPPALYALAPERVIHIGSFSKSLAPALRIGYALADWQILGRVMALKTDGTGAIDQMVAAEYFGRFFDQHMTTLSGALRHKLNVMVESVEREFGTAVDMWVPEGGIFLWLTLPEHIDVRFFAGKALEAGVAFNPGPEWSTDPGKGGNFLRLCFALPDEATIRAGVAELARVCFEATGVPQRSGNLARKD